MSDSEKTERPRWHKTGIDLLALAGAASLSYGCWLIYQPAAYLVAGALALGTAVLLARAG